jgi:hypothetical protein
MRAPRSYLTKTGKSAGGRKASRGFAALIPGRYDGVRGAGRGQASGSHAMGIFFNA